MTPSHHPTWTHLLRLAEEEVRSVLQAMPVPLCVQAREVPVTYQPRPTPGQTGTELDDDLLGLFVGLPFPEAESGAAEIPAQIFLFLANIWDEAEDAEDRYREEVRTTYLHELGHYLGLEEDGLEARDLE